MTRSPDSYSAENEVEDLQPVTFELVEQDDPRVVVYQGRVEDRAQYPGAEYLLRVTAASPGKDEQMEAALREFLGQIRAGFLPFAEPDPGSPGDEAPEPFDPGQHTKLEFAQVKSAPPLPDGVGMVVQTTTEYQVVQATTGNEVVQATTGIDMQLRDFKGTVGPGGKDHYWNSDYWAWARVDALEGKGRIRWPREPVAAVNQYSRWRKTVIVHGVSALTYRFHGSSFRLTVA